SGIPSNAVAAIVNLTQIPYSGSGYGWMTMWPSGMSIPGTSNINFTQSSYAIANSAVVKLGSGDGKACVVKGSGYIANPTSDAIIDVTGYIPASSNGQLQLISNPVRVVDTRSGSGVQGQGTHMNGGAQCYQVSNQMGIPNGATAALVNLTAIPSS